MNCFFIFLISCVMFAPLSFAQQNLIDPDNSKAISDFIGTVMLSKGQIKKLRSGEEIVVAEKGKILAKDVIKTGKASVVKIKMLDDTVMTLGPETQFEFSKFVFKSKDDRQSIYNFVNGQVRAHFPVKSKEGDIEFKTKTTSMGIRGTTLLANVQKNGNVENTEYLLLEGKIEVNNILNNSKKVLEPGDHYLLNAKGETIEEESSNKIAPELLNELLALSKDELTDLKPFLPYHLYKKIKQALNVSSNGRAPASVQEISEGSSQVIPKNKESKTVKWKKTLNDLNDELKNNGPK